LRFASAHEITQRFVLGVGHEHGREITAAVGAFELLGVAVDHEY
jgi:hypothetical protein